MATEIKLPDMGEGIDDVTISRWRCRRGRQRQRRRCHFGSRHRQGRHRNRGAGRRHAAQGQFPARVSWLRSLPCWAYIGAEGGRERPGDGRGGPSRPLTMTSRRHRRRTAAGAATAAAAAADARERMMSRPRPSPSACRRRQRRRPGRRCRHRPGRADHQARCARLAAASAPEAVQAPARPGGPPALPGDLADEPSLVVRRAAADFNINLAEIAEGRPLSTLTKYDVLSAAASRAEGKQVKVEPAFPPPSAAPAAPPAPAARAGCSSGCAVTTGRTRRSQGAGSCTGAGAAQARRGVGQALAHARCHRQEHQRFRLQRAARHHHVGRGHERRPGNTGRRTRRSLPRPVSTSRSRPTLSRPLSPGCARCRRPTPRTRTRA